MLVYRITKSAERCLDLSGFGAYKYGGRWNSMGTYMLYISENSSLAFLENLVHFESENLPPNLFIATVELSVPESMIKDLPSFQYPKNWQTIGCTKIRHIGDDFIKSQHHIALKVKSAINVSEYNYLINPLFAGYHDLVKIKNMEKINVDVRLFK